MLKIFMSFSSLAPVAPVAPVKINKFSELVSKHFITEVNNKSVVVELHATGVLEVDQTETKLTRPFASYTWIIKITYGAKTNNVFMTTNETIVLDVFAFCCKYPVSIFNREKNLNAYKELLLSNQNAKKKGFAVLSLKEIENSDPVNNINIGMMSFEKNHSSKKPRTTKKTCYLTIGTNFDLKTELSTGEVKTIQFKNDDEMLAWLEKLEAGNKYNVVMI